MGRQSNLKKCNISSFHTTYFYCFPDLSSFDGSCIIYCYQPFTIIDLYETGANLYYHFKIKSCKVITFAKFKGHFPLICLLLQMPGVHFWG